MILDLAIGFWNTGVTRTLVSRPFQISGSLSMGNIPWLAESQNMSLGLSHVSVPFRICWVVPHDQATFPELLVRKSTPTSQTLVRFLKRRAIGFCTKNEFWRRAKKKNQTKQQRVYLFLNEWLLLHFFQRARPACFQRVLLFCLNAEVLQHYQFQHYIESLRWNQDFFEVPQMTKWKG